MKRKLSIDEAFELTIMKYHSISRDDTKDEEGEDEVYNKNRRFVEKHKEFLDFESWCPMCQYVLNSGNHTCPISNMDHLPCRNYSNGCIYGESKYGAWRRSATKENALAFVSFIEERRAMVGDGRIVHDKRLEFFHYPSALDRELGLYNVRSREGNIEIEKIWNERKAKWGKRK